MASSVHVIGSSRKSAYSSVWNTSARNAARDRRASGLGAHRGAARPAPRDQRDVDELSDQALLGGDRDRDRVRGRQRLPDLVVVGAVLGLERARAEPPERPSGEQVSPPVTRPARPLEAPFSPWLRPKSSARSRPPRRRARRPPPRRTPRPASRPAQRRERPSPTSSAPRRRPRQRQQQAAPQHASAPHASSCSRRGRRTASSAAQQDHHQRQETAEDVRVVEHRVDDEVRVQIVLRDQLRVEEDRLGRVLDERDDANTSASPTTSCRQRAISCRFHVDAAQQHVEQRERHIEEHHVLERLREVARVGRLDRVQDDVQRQQPLDPAAGRRGSRSAGAGGASSARSAAVHDSSRDDRTRAAGGDQRYSGTSRLLVVVGSVSIGILNGSAAITRIGNTAACDAAARHGAERHDRDRAPTAAQSGWRWTMCNCDECQMSASNRTGESTSAPSIAGARDAFPGREQHDHAASAASRDEPIFGSGPDSAASRTRAGGYEKPEASGYPRRACPLRIAPPRSSGSCGACGARAGRLRQHREGRTPARPASGPTPGIRGKIDMPAHRHGQPPRRA